MSAMSATASAKPIWTAPKTCVPILPARLPAQSGARQVSRTRTVVVAAEPLSQQLDNAAEAWNEIGADVLTDDPGLRSTFNGVMAAILGSVATAFLLAPQAAMSAWSAFSPVDALGIFLARKTALALIPVACTYYALMASDKESRANAPTVRRVNLAWFLRTLLGVSCVLAYKDHFMAKAFTTALGMLGVQAAISAYQMSTNVGSKSKLSSVIDGAVDDFVNLFSIGTNAGLVYGALGIMGLVGGVAGFNPDKMVRLFPMVADFLPGYNAVMFRFTALNTFVVSWMLLTLKAMVDSSDTVSESLFKWMNIGLAIMFAGSAIVSVHGFLAPAPVIDLVPWTAKASVGVEVLAAAFCAMFASKGVQGLRPAPAI